jgi:hypothetical protein
LRNPRNDATVWPPSEGLGFDVIVGLDLDQQQFAATVDLARQLEDADVGAVFAGGLQITAELSCLGERAPDQRF